MAPRFHKAVAEGCHGVEPDNINCYDVRFVQRFWNFTRAPLQNQGCWGNMSDPIVKSGKDVLPQQLTYDSVCSAQQHHRTETLALIYASLRSGWRRTGTRSVLRL